jgi:poly-beta-1,6-N-acetyl-D-glucosamine N-deacetylase
VRLSDAICLGLRLTLLPLLVRESLQAKRVTILAYHAPSPKTFERHLRFLRRAYNLTSLRELAGALRGGSLKALPRKSLVITLDDGHRSNHSLLAVLERHRVPVTVFLCSGMIESDGQYWFHTVRDPEPLKRVSDAERLELLAAMPSGTGGAGTPREALNREELHELRSLVDFQAHTISHPILPACSTDKAAREIEGAKQELEGRHGFEVYALAYPNGDHGDREERLAERAGYQCALTMDAGFNRATTNRFRLRRIAVNDHDSVSVLAVRACGLWEAARSVVRWRSQTVGGVPERPKGLGVQPRGG